jgi:hypothetical protein
MKIQFAIPFTVLGKLMVSSIHICCLTIIMLDEVETRDSDGKQN